MDFLSPEWSVSASVIKAHSITESSFCEDASWDEDVVSDTLAAAPGQVPQYSLTANGQYISMFVVTSDGVMVFDPMNRKHSEAMLTEIRKITQVPIKYLFYSHNHWDHTSGGEVFRREGAKVVSHIEAYDYIIANPNPEVVRPDMTWSGDRFDVSLGDFTVELHYLGLSHGLGMTTFVLPKQKVS